VTSPILQVRELTQHYGGLTANDEITLQELERRVELEVDQEATRIREAVEPVNDVGPATSAAIAENFDTLEEIRQASVEDLEEIHGIGPSTAEAVKQRLT
jgi:NAD-dependent DNA ligase